MAGEEEGWGRRKKGVQTREERGIKKRMVLAHLLVASVLPIIDSLPIEYSYTKIGDNFKPIETS